MQKAVLYAIIAVVVVAAGIGIAFAATSFMNGNNTAEPSTDQQSFDSNKVRTIEHAMGTTEITGVPERIVVLEWVYAEDLLALGVQPVGVADIKGMNEWVNLKDAKLADSVVDVGTRQEPNLEAITQLEPDLIIGVQFRVEGMYDQLSTIAPTIVFNPYPLEEENLGQFEEMEQTFTAIADIVGKSEQGKTVLDRMNASFDSAAAEIRASEAAGKPFVLAQTWSTDGAPFMRLFSNNGMATQIMEKMGMQNAWKVEYEQYGFSDAGLEALTTVDDASFFYIAQENDNIFQTIYKDNPVWNNLQFVQEDRVYPLGGDTWTFGGPISAEVLAKKAAATVAGAEPDTKTISHAMGETKIEGTPERAIIMDIVTLETFLHLGIQPVGLSSLDIQKSWNPEISTKWPDVVDVGNTYEPNFEIIAQMEPDVIFASESEHSEMYDELSSIAPTIMLNNWPHEDGSTMLKAVEKNIMTVSDVMNRSKDGAAYLDEFGNRIEEYKKRVDAAGLTGSKFILANAVAFEGQPAMFLFVPNSQNSEILERMGLDNAVSLPDEFARYGHTEVSLEALAALDSQDVHFIYVTSPGGGDPVADPEHWKNHPVWNNLSFVKEGRVHHIGQINMFRGPIELEKVADATIEALTTKNE